MLQGQIRWLTYFFSPLQQKYTDPGSSEEQAFSDSGKNHQCICFSFTPAAQRVLTAAKEIPIFVPMDMININTIIAFALGAALAGLAAYIARQKNKPAAVPQPKAEGSPQLRLQAYERLTLLVDRIALPNLISRVSQAGLNAKEMQLLLTRNIREEYEYNITQQIYVSPEAWNAVKNLKEQNLLVINQLSNALPPTATGLDLNKHLLEYLMTDKKGSLHEVVSEVLSYEAKALL